MLCGNPAKMLSRRKREAGPDATSPEPSGGAGDGGGGSINGGGGRPVHENDDILAQLRQWKIEMAATFSRFENQREDAGGAGWYSGGVQQGGQQQQQQRFVPMPPPGPKPSGGAGPATGPGSGVVIRSQNPTPRAAAETSSGGVDRLVLE
jgi:hypothetical protein